MEYYYKPLSWKLEICCIRNSVSQMMYEKALIYTVFDEIFTRKRILLSINNVVKT